VLGDVPHDPLNQGGLTGLILNEEGLIPNPYDPALLGKHPIFRTEGVAIVMAFGHLREDPFPVFGMNLFGPQLKIGKPIRRGETQHRFDLRTDVESSPGLIDRGDISSGWDLL
jgi:hypothetical protein